MMVRTTFGQPFFVTLAMAASVIGIDLAHAAQGIRGYYDPVKRSFTPLAPRVPQTNAAPTTLSGTFQVTLSVKIDTKIPSNVVIGAFVTVTAQDPATQNPAAQYQSSLRTDLTRKGNTGTASLTVPYSYKLADPTVPVVFQLTLFEVAQTASGSPSPTTAFQPNNTRTQQIAMPKNGATTPVTIAGSI